MKKIVSIILALTMALSLSATALASSYTDVSDGAQYADAVEYVTEHGLMDAAADGTFAPDESAPRSIVAEALWRVAGRPQAAKTATFPDVGADDGNRGAIDWAAEAGVMITGMPGSLFAPRANISRAMVAAILMRYDKMVKAEAPTVPPEPKVLVAYFSATNNTAKVAAQIADATGAVLHQITPETPYTSNDLNYTDSATRATREQNDPAARPAISGAVENMADYDVVFLGYPIWWGQAPKILYTFVESYDLAGKTVVPFCTSGSSPIGASATNLQKSASEAKWLSGSRFSGSASRDSIVSWLNGLDLDITVK